MKFLFQEETTSNRMNHKKISFRYLDDILLLYPGFIKTALFEKFIFNEESELDPSFIIYDIHPLTKCGHFVNWNKEPPERFTDYEDPIDTRGIIVLNKFTRENNLMKIIYQKLNHYKKRENRKYNIWFEFETYEFINI